MRREWVFRMALAVITATLAMAICKSDIEYGRYSTSVYRSVAPSFENLGKSPVSAR